ncbi:LLM class flavin-dependent oxidoreductase [Micromonospora sp. DH15]|nr:LLM class flavin-dependent oxidoreductase [Micromonospora sp. DH15]
MNLFPVSDGTSDHQVLRETLDEIQLADELGFDSIWLAEHHFSKYGILGSPVNFGMAVAERTRRITIGTAVLVLPLHHPLRLAEDIAALDVLSGGRVRIGVGRGYQPAEFAGFGIPLEESKQRYQETLEILRLALSQENFSYHGQIFHYDNVTTYPRPHTPGGPPILQGTVSPDSFRERGAVGESIITSPNFTPLGIMQKNFSLYRRSMRENAAFGVAWDDRLRRLREYVPTLRSLWNGETVDLAGSWGEVPGASLALRPVQPGGPPLWIGAFAEPAIRRAARLDAPWLIGPKGNDAELARLLGIYRADLAERGFALDREYPMTREAYLGDSYAGAVAAVRPHLQRQYAGYKSWDDAQSLDLDRYLAEDCLVGSADEIVDKLRRWETDLGITEVSLRHQFVGAGQDEAMEPLARFGAEVIARVDTAPTGREASR